MSLNSLSATTSSRSVSFVHLPSKLSKFTMTRAPMAHKTWSKEQYKRKLFFFNLSIKHLYLTSSPSSNELLFLFILLKRTTCFIETNLLYLKSFYFKFSAQDTYYFNFHKFAKTHHC